MERLTAVHSPPVRGRHALGAVVSGVCAAGTHLTMITSPVSLSTVSRYRVLSSRVSPGNSTSARLTHQTSARASAGARQPPGRLSRRRAACASVAAHPARISRSLAGPSVPTWLPGQHPRTVTRPAAAPAGRSQTRRRAGSNPGRREH